MDRYDRGWGRGYGREFGTQRGGGYADDFRGWSPGWFHAAGYPGPRSAGWGTGTPGRWRAVGGGRGYDREPYGRGYPSFGGGPGGRERGMYRGGWGQAGEAPRYPRGYDAGFGGRFGGEPGGGFGRGTRGGFGGGYDQRYARGPFLPEHVYREHPELDRPRRGLTGEWPQQPGGGAGYGMELDDDDVRDRVERSLQQDGWVDAGRIQVEVDDGVVTLAGEVDDYLEARYAWDDAWEADGVRGVINNLTVRTDQPMGKHGEPFPQAEGGAARADAASAATAAAGSTAATTGATGGAKRGKK